MSERSKTISRLRNDLDSRISYIKAKIGVLVPSKIRALRLKSNMPRQADLAKAAGMHQSRISMFETPGAANLTVETLARLAAVFKVGLTIDFVPFSEMLRWENNYSQDTFEVTRIDDDCEFIAPEAASTDVKTFDLCDYRNVSNVSAAVPTGCSYKIAQNKNTFPKVGPIAAKMKNEIHYNQAAGGAKS
jgi:transcriptional regulator with XRE-family HTH domain